ncbi:MAG: inositol monophosphatase [Candidatus Levybacteria bacterium]|nr:inositol monophosphatase [Candidatus Levybacteria bacterium]
MAGRKSAMEGVGMTMNETMRNLLEQEKLSVKLRFTIDLANKAGEVIVASRGGKVTQKEGISNIQTEGDLNSERVIVDGISAQFPQDSILSEETKTEIENPLDIARLWVIDPIDGSANYAHGIDEVWVSVGQVRFGKGHIGVAHNPFQRKTYFAESGKGTYILQPKTPGSDAMELKRIQVGNRTELKDATLETSMSYDAYQSRSHNIIKLYLSFLGMDVRPREIGSSVGQLCRVAAGMSDIHMHTGLKPWDYAAPSVILAEAGAVMRRADGSEFNPLLHRDNISGNAVLVEKLVEAIGEIKGNKEFSDFIAQQIEDFTV